MLFFQAISAIAAAELLTLVKKNWEQLLIVCPEKYKTIF